MKRAVLCLLLLATPALAAQPPREWWPPKVTILANAGFQNGKSVRKGQEVLVADVQPNGLKLDDGSMYFMFDPKKTDFDKRMEQRLASLKDEQKALRLNDVLTREELWPVRVTLRQPILMNGVDDFPVGFEWVLIGVNRDRTIQVVSPARETILDLDPWTTDFFDRARDRLLREDLGQVSFGMRSFDSMLEPSAEATPVFERDYLVLYAGRDACPRATHYAPELAAMLDRLPEEGADWELIFVNAFDSAEENRIHHANMGLTGRPALEGHGQIIRKVLGLQSGITPRITLLDGQGNQLAWVSEDGVSTPPEVVIAQIEQTLTGAGR